MNPSSQKAKANTPLGTYARQYLDSLAGTIDPTTIEGYEKIYRTHIAPVFGSKPVASITTADVHGFRGCSVGAASSAHAGASQAQAATVTRSPKTVKHIVGTLKRILDTAQDDQAIASNPVVAVAVGTPPSAVLPQTASTVQAPSAVGQSGSERYVTGLPQRPQGRGNACTRWLSCLRRTRVFGRASCRVCRLQDVTLSDIPGTVGSIRVVRTAEAQGPRSGSTARRRATPAPDRVVPLAPWLADELRDYLTDVTRSRHQHAGQASTSRTLRCFLVAATATTFDWAKPVHAGNLYDTISPACRGVGPRRRPLPRLAPHLRHA